MRFTLKLNNFLATLDKAVPIAKTHTLQLH